jgi:murein DD-endopeptidase MepM/ murein hydrolase activator NlpD
MKKFKHRSEKWGVYAAKDGKVVTAYMSKSYGKTVIIDHSDGYRTLYAHNSILIVKTGEVVKKGQLIAMMGSTGWGIPKPNKHGHLGLIPPGRPLTNLKVNCINPVPWLVDGGCYPYNTKVTYGFQHNYGSYFHEGIDFSGLEKNLIKGWKNGIDANTQKYY